MKIGLVVPGFSANESDWCIPAVLDMVRLLAEQHEVHVFTLRYPAQASKYTVYNATVHAMGGVTQAAIYRLPLLIRAIASVIQAAPFDVLHGLWADEPGFVAVTAGRILRVPVIVSLMGGELVNMPKINYGHQLSRAARWMIRFSTRNVPCVTVGSSNLLQLAQTQIDVTRLAIIPLGVDTERFFPGESAVLEGGFKLLHVAALTPIKNHMLILHAFTEVQRTLPDAHLHLVGDGVLRAQLEAYSADLGLHVTFHGDTPHEQLPDYYRAADLCILTSHFESQSMVTLEAGACGRITVGTPVGILPELHQSFISKPALPDAAQKLAAIITHLAQNPEKRSELNQQVYQQVNARYSLQASIKAWQDLYVRLAQQSNRPSSRKSQVSG